MVVAGTISLIRKVNIGVIMSFFLSVALIFVPDKVSLINGHISNLQTIAFLACVSNALLLLLLLLLLLFCSFFFFCIKKIR